MSQLYGEPPRRGEIACLAPAGGFHRMRFVEWGAPDHPHVVVCVHGLTRNGRDFDGLASRLARDARVICPDVVGRGASERLRDPAGYGYPQYLSDLAALVAYTGAAQVDWVGTSMGGLIGMFLAAQPGTPLRRLVMNDVGPFVPKASLERLAQYVGRMPPAASLAHAEATLREVAAPFGPLTDAQWRHLAEHTFARGADGLWRSDYDPGADSDLLLADTAQRMVDSAPGRVTLTTVPHTGHAPMLMDDAQIEDVERFLFA
jgi:pimeloyl-ACP methyl ester carboxylesterase